MGLKKQKVGRQFGLDELGILDGPTLRGAETVVKMAETVLQVRRTAFLVFDDLSASISVRICSALQYVSRNMPATGSLCSQIRSERQTLAFKDTCWDGTLTPERRNLGAVSFLGAPVFGPTCEPVGVLAAIELSQRSWTRAECRKLDDLAHLISQEIMLRASVETLRIMSEERDWMKS